MKKLNTKNSGTTTAIVLWQPDFFQRLFSDSRSRACRVLLRSIPRCAVSCPRSELERWAGSLRSILAVGEALLEDVKYDIDVGSFEIQSRQKKNRTSSDLVLGKERSHAR